MTSATLDLQVAPAFPTLIGRRQIAGIDRVNQELASLILDREASSPSVDHANFGGWHSASDLLEWPGEAIGSVRGWITEALQRIVQASLQLPESQGRGSPPRGSFRLSAWANVARRGNYHRMHNHPASTWSGCYYVTGTGDTDPGSLGGVLEFYDPRPFTEMVETPGSPYGQRMLIRPNPGLLVVFPSWLYHFVHPSTSDGPRISIAFNAAWRTT
jgi:uncharacterized protein (TIGR02466 family)